MRLGMHQSQYLPWPPYFKKIAAVDCFVLMDSVQYQKNGLQNRNQVRNKQGAFWLTIPVSGRLEDRISEKRIADAGWARKHWKSLQAAYGRAPYWSEHREALQELYAQNYFTLGQVNEKFLCYLLEATGIDTPVVNLSSLGVDGAKSELLLNCCRALGADCYVSGRGAVDYLDFEAFVRAGIDVELMPSRPVSYAQGKAEFIPDLSIVDMLMFQGRDAVHRYLYSENI